MIIFTEEQIAKLRIIDAELYWVSPVLEAEKLMALPPPTDTLEYNKFTQCANEIKIRNQEKRDCIAAAINYYENEIRIKKAFQMLDE
jgi:hypothetical protein